MGRYLKGTAGCILRWLKPGEDGKLVLPVSSSPEIHDDRIEAWLKPNSNYDLSLMRYLFKTLIKMSEILGNDENAKWQKILDQLSELVITDIGVLKLSPNEELMESHRHHAQCMAIHPLCLLDYTKDEDKKIIDATVKNLEMLGSGLWVGYSFTWMAEMYAIQGNGEGAAYQLKLFFENFCSQNGFHLNGDYKKRGLSAFHYRPFTLEGNMCAADAIQEMLLQTKNGVIDVFPAVPDWWKEEGVSFNNFRGEKGVLISAEYEGGELKYISLCSDKNVELKVINKFIGDKIKISKYIINNNSCFENTEPTKEYIYTCKIKDTFAVIIEKGYTYLISI